MPKTRFKTAIYEQIARIGKATASPGRLELLDLLAQGPRTVEAIAVQINQSVANTSHHLQVLRRARLVDADRAGVHVTYRLADDQVGAFLLQLRGIADSRLAEIEQVTRDYMKSPDGLEAIGNEELLRRIRAGAVTLLDVRPREEYLAGHIPGAISVPVLELPGRLREFTRRKDVVAYCRGPYCVMAKDAVGILRRNGFRAYRLELGIPEWKARGWRVDKSRDVVVKRAG